MVTALIVSILTTDMAPAHVIQFFLGLNPDIRSSQAAPFNFAAVLAILTLAAMATLVGLAVNHWMLYMFPKPNPNPSRSSSTGSPLLRAVCSTNSRASQLPMAAHDWGLLAVFLFSLNPYWA